MKNYEGQTVILQLSFRFPGNENVKKQRRRYFPEKRMKGGDPEVGWGQGKCVKCQLIIFFHVFLTIILPPNLVGALPTSLMPK